MKKKLSALFMTVIVIVFVMGGVMVSPVYAHEKPDVKNPVAKMTIGAKQTKDDKTEPEESDLPQNIKPTEKENQTLISETEVNTFLVRFYDQDDTLLHEIPGVKGRPVEKPEQNPQQAGQIFSHWYLVDKHLEGDSLEPYDFERAITGLTYLKAKYLPYQEELQIPEYMENEAHDNSEELPNESLENHDILQESLNENYDNIKKSDIRKEIVVQLSVVLTVEGGQVSDGAYQALLTGGELPETGITVANEGEEFPFPELVFTAEDEGTHVFQVEALVEEPLPLHTYDLNKYEVLVEVIVEEEGQVAANVIYPQEADHLLISHSVREKTPSVRVYVNLLPGQTIDYGDEVVFTAEMEDCGESPRIQWQFSSDCKTWTDITGGNETELAVLITPSNATGYWRVAVMITD